VTRRPRPSRGAPTALPGTASSRPGRRRLCRRSPARGGGPGGGGVRRRRLGDPAVGRPSAQACAVRRAQWRLRPGSRPVSGRHRPSRRCGGREDPRLPHRPGQDDHPRGALRRDHRGHRGLRPPGGAGGRGWGAARGVARSRGHRPRRRAHRLGRRHSRARLRVAGARSSGCRCARRAPGRVAWRARAPRRGRPPARADAALRTRWPRGRGRAVVRDRRPRRFALPLVRRRRGDAGRRPDRAADALRPAHGGGDRCRCR